MTPSRASHLALGGLIVLMIGLFAAAFQLNRRARDISMETVELSFARTLDEQKELLLQRLDQEEERLFALAETDRVLEADLFIDRQSTFLPACLKNITESVAAAEADEAFQKGVDLLPDTSAAEPFKIAAKSPLDSEEGMYIRLSALFNLLDFNGEDPCLIAPILALLDPNKTHLPDARRRFFRSMLSERIGPFEEIEARLNGLTETADALNRTVERQHGAYRAGFDARVFSVRADGLAVLHSPDLTTISSIGVSSNPIGFHREIAQGLYITTSAEALEGEKSRILQQYRTNNTALAIFAALGLALSIGIGANARRRRKLEAARAQFVATVSHELRTPLSLIRLHAETLKHGRIPEEKVAAYHQTILTEAERLTGIVNNVLDFSRLERDQLQVHPEPTDLAALVHRVADAFADRLELEGFALELDIAEGVTARIDPLAYSQIVFNLLDNAMKYSDGEKCIWIELAADGDSSILRVMDRGIGIPDTLKPRVFDEFVRADDQRVTARRGSGIGLSVAKRLAERMNGTITIADNEPRGTVFAVRLSELKAE